MRFSEGVRRVLGEILLVQIRPQKGKSRSGIESGRVGLASWWVVARMCLKWCSLQRLSSPKTVLSHGLLSAVLWGLFGVILLYHEAGERLVLD